MTQTTTYDEQAQRFLVDTQTTFAIEYVDEACPEWEHDDKHIHGNHYRFTLTSRRGRYTSDFWNSYKDALKKEIADSMNWSGYKAANLIRKARKVTPSAYDVLACLGPTDDEDLMGPLQFFIESYGFDNADHAIAAREKLIAETLGLRRLFNEDELQLLAGIA